MKRFLLICIFCCVGIIEAAVIWQEDFSSYTNAGITGAGAVNYPSGTTNWSVNISECATLAAGNGGTGDYFMAVSTGGGRMEAVNIDGEAVWSSAVIAISNYTNIALSVITSETGSSTSTNKYVKTFYRLNGGAETAFAENPVNTGNWSASTASQSNLCGSTVQVIVRVNNPNSSDKSILDSVVVSGDLTANTNSGGTEPVVVVPVCGASHIAGKFHGWSGDTIFKLEIGQFWQQCAAGAKVVDPPLYRPSVTVTNTLGRYRLYVTNVTGFVTVAPVAVTESTTDTFTGLHNQNIYLLADGTVWKQISFENVSVPVSPVTVWRWMQDGQQMLRFLDRDNNVFGTCAAEPLTGYSESVITNSFAGLHYGNVYQLANGQSWMQVSFENIQTNLTQPNVLLWMEGTATRLLTRDSRGVTVGLCTVINPDTDADGDGLSNHHEILAGSNPEDPQSKFTLHQQDGRILNWKSVEGRVYTVEWTSALTESFQTLETGITWPQNGWTDTVHAAEASGYYRITVRCAE